MFVKGMELRTKCCGAYPNIFPLQVLNQQNGWTRVKDFKAIPAGFRPAT